jgi:hypothetical protein
LFLTPVAPVGRDIFGHLNTAHCHFVDETPADRFRASEGSSRSAFPDLIEFADSFPNT